MVMIYIAVIRQSHHGQSTNVVCVFCPVATIEQGREPT